MPDIAVNDWGDSIFLATTTALNNLIAAVPLVLGAIVILIIGWLLSNVLAGIVRRGLEAIGADRLFALHGTSVYGERASSIRPSAVGAELTRWLIRLVFLVAAANVLNMPQISLFLNQVLLWVPNLVVAAIILMVAPLLARFVRGAIEVAAGQMGFMNGELLGRIAEVAIVAFGIVVAINQVGIAANLVNTLFVGIVAALALGFGLAFGLGGQGVAAEMTRAWYERSRQTAGRIAQSGAPRATGPGARVGVQGATAPTRARPR